MRIVSIKLTQLQNENVCTATAVQVLARSLVSFFFTLVQRPLTHTHIHTFTEQSHSVRKTQNRILSTRRVTQLYIADLFSVKIYISIFVEVKGTHIPFLQWIFAFSSERICVWAVSDGSSVFVFSFFHSHWFGAKWKLEFGWVWTKYSPFIRVIRVIGKSVCNFLFPIVKCCLNLFLLLD